MCNPEEETAARAVIAGLASEKKKRSVKRQPQNASSQRAAEKGNKMTVAAHDCRNCYL